MKWLNIKTLRKKKKKKSSRIRESSKHENPVTFRCFWAIGKDRISEREQIKQRQKREAEEENS